MLWWSHDHWAWLVDWILLLFSIQSYHILLLSKDSYFILRKCALAIFKHICRPNRESRIQCNCFLACLGSSIKNYQTFGRNTAGCFTMTTLPCAQSSLSRSFSQKVKLLEVLQVPYHSDLPVADFFCWKECLKVFFVSVEEIQGKAQLTSVSSEPSTEHWKKYKHN